MRCGPGRPWSSSIQVHGHTKHGSRPPVLPVWAMGPRLPIHTTMAQPLAFLILDGIGWEPRVYPSPDGPPRYESSPPKPIQSQLCTPMQQPMRRLNNELGHKVVDKVWMFMWMLVHMEGWDGTKSQKLAIEGPRSLVQDLCKCAQVPCLLSGVPFFCTYGVVCHIFPFSTFCWLACVRAWCVMCVFITHKPESSTA